MKSREMIRIPTKLKIATGSYNLQTVGSKFINNSEPSTCKLCNTSFIFASVKILETEDIRKPIFEDLFNLFSEELAVLNMRDEQFDIFQLMSYAYLRMLRK